MRLFAMTSSRSFITVPSEKKLHVYLLRLEKFCAAMSKQNGTTLLVIRIIGSKT